MLRMSRSNKLDNKKKRKEPQEMKKMWRNGVTYAFTQTFIDTFQEFDTPIVRKMHDLIRTSSCMFKHLKKFCKFTLYPEFSTPTETWKLIDRSAKLGLTVPLGPRFHFHGTIKFFDVGGFYMSHFARLLAWGAFKIEEIYDKKYWTKYKRKDKPVMKPLLEKYGYPHKFTNKFVFIVSPSAKRAFKNGDSQNRY